MKYSDIPVLDLRKINDVATIKAIEEISDVALVIFPKGASEEVNAAFSSISLHDIGQVLYLDKDIEVNVMNGICELNDTSFKNSEKSILLINGMFVIKQLSKETTGRIILNGIGFIQKDLKENITFPVINGTIKYLDFDDFKMFPNSAEVDADLLSYLNDKTLLAAGKELIIKGDVTSQMLADKGIVLIAGKQITCGKKIAGYIKANAIAGKSIEIIDDYE